MSDETSGCLSGCCSGGCVVLFFLFALIMGAAIVGTDFVVKTLGKG